MLKSKIEHSSISFMTSLRYRTCLLGKFGTVGIFSTGVYYATLWCLVELLHLTVLTATSIAFLLVSMKNYVLHYVWTFASTRSHAVSLPRFLFMVLVGFCINWMIMFIGVDRLVLNYLLGQAVAIAAIVTWNFVLASCWIFSDTRTTH